MTPVDKCHIVMAGCAGLIAGSVLYLATHKSKPVHITLNSLQPDPNLVRESIDRALREQERRRARIHSSIA